MQFLVLALCFFAATTAFPTWEYPIHPGVGAIYKGPDSETIIKGPDGSVITAEAKGGAVDTKAEPVVAPEPVPALVEAPIVAEEVPVKFEDEEEEIVPEPIPVYAEPEYFAEPVVAAVEPIKETTKVELEGPSGKISTDGVSSVVSGPASTTITGPEVKLPAPKLIPVALPAPKIVSFEAPKLLPSPEIVAAPILPKFEPVPVLKEVPLAKSVTLVKPAPVTVELAKEVPVAVSIPKIEKVFYPLPKIAAPIAYYEGYEGLPKFEEPLYKPVYKTLYKGITLKDY